ncbi:MAG: hypothetical protein AB7O52_06825 [Planctomycetota bacterium]
MRESLDLARIRLTVSALCLAVFIEGCGGSSDPLLAVPSSVPSPPVTGAVVSKPASSLYLEETAAAFFVELSRSELFTFESYCGLRFVPWRHVSRAGGDAKIRMALGYGTGFSREVHESIVKAGGEVPDASLVFFGMMNRFEENTYFQLSAHQARDLIAFIEDFEKIELKTWPDHVVTRFVEGHWGDLRVRKTDTGMFVSVPSSGWEPLPTNRFKGALRKALADLERLEAGDPSAAW